MLSTRMIRLSKIPGSHRLPRLEQIKRVEKEALSYKWFVPCRSCAMHSCTPSPRIDTNLAGNRGASPTTSKAMMDKFPLTLTQQKAPAASTELRGPLPQQSSRRLKRTVADHLTSLELGSNHCNIHIPTTMRVSNTFEPFECVIPVHGFRLT